MNAKDFKECGTAVLEFITNYMDTIRERNVVPSVEPGYLEPLLPTEAPIKGESWQDIFKDFEKHIMPGITHWHSPHFHAYFPASNSYPSIIGEMLSAGLGIICFNWMNSPACTELEVIVMDWMAKMLGLPEQFLNSSEGPGGGAIATTASESTLICLLAAKKRTICQYKQLHPELSETEITEKLVAYSSDQSNSSIEKAGLIAAVRMKLLPSDSEGRLKGIVLKRAMEEDRKNGYIPCYVVATLGTSGTCAFDGLDELGPICKEADVWLHVDAAYAGTAFCCPEFRYLLKGAEYSDSFTFNPHKWMLVTFDCSALWLKNADYLVDALSVDRVYLRHKHEGTCPEFMHWQVPLGRKFRALKLWFVLRSYGIEGIQKHVRRHVALATQFTSYVHDDSRFELKSSRMGLVCFKLKGHNRLTKMLFDRILESKKMYIVQCKADNEYLIRFAITSEITNYQDILDDWKQIVEITDGIIPRVQRKKTMWAEQIGSLMIIEK